MKIAILDDYQDVVRDLDCYALLKSDDVKIITQPLNAELIKSLKDREALVLIRERTQINAEFLAQLPNLKWISQTGKKSQHLDMEACEKAGVSVLEGIGSPVAPAELTWALIMAASRHIPTYVREFENGYWQSADGLGLGRCLKGLTIGIWGYGKIGQRIAKYADAFDMQVMVWGSEASRQSAVADGYQAADSKTHFFQQADILTLHLRLNEATTAIVSKADLLCMKKDALFVNTSRAELVEKGALDAALDTGTPGFAALDVYEIEPYDKDAYAGGLSLLERKNVLCSPHLGYVEKNSYELYFKVAFENLLAVK